MSANATNNAPAIGIKQFTLDVLNGSSLGVVVALIPAALTSQILALFPGNHVAGAITMMVTVAQSLLSVFAAMAVGHMLRLETLDAACIALATFVSSGAITTSKGVFVLNGTGSILNIMLTTFISAAMVLLIHRHLGQLKLVIEPTIVLIIGGGIGILTLPAMVAVQTFVGQLVASATHLTPILMGIVLGIIFAVLIVSPLSSVGIAMAIALTGIGSGAANAGIVVASFTLAWIGASANPLGGTLAHFLGSPKIQMANMLRRPLLFVPVIIGAGICGGAASLLQMNGTPFSAGFGFAGLIGPLTALQQSHGVLVWLRVLLTFVVIPVLAAGGLKWLFVNQLGWIKPQDAQLGE